MLHSPGRSPMRVGATGPRGPQWLLWAQAPLAQRPLGWGAGSALTPQLWVVPDEGQRPLFALSPNWPCLPPPSVLAANPPSLWSPPFALVALSPGLAFPCLHPVCLCHPLHPGSQAEPKADPHQQLRSRGCGRLGGWTLLGVGIPVPVGAGCVGGCCRQVLCAGTEVTLSSHTRSHTHKGTCEVQLQAWAWLGGRARQGCGHPQQGSWGYDLSQQ